MDQLKIIRIWVQIGITVVLILFSIYLLVTETSDSALVKWAFGTLGIIIGYWLK